METTDCGSPDGQAWMNPLVQWRESDRDVQDHRGRARWRHAPKAGDLQLRQRLRAERRDVATHTGTRIQQSGWVQRHVVAACRRHRPFDANRPVEYAEPTELTPWTTTYAQYVPFGRPLPSQSNVALLFAATAFVPTFVPFQLPSSVVAKTSAVPATVEKKEIG